MEGEYVEKVVVDRGAWGEYDDNPIDVRDLRHIIQSTAMVGGMTLNMFNPRTGVVLYRLDVRAISDELRVSLHPKVDYHNDN